MRKVLRVAAIAILFLATLSGCTTRATPPVNAGGAQTEKMVPKADLEAAEAKIAQLQKELTDRQHQEVELQRYIRALETLQPEFNSSKTPYTIACQTGWYMVFPEMREKIAWPQLFREMAIAIASVSEMVPPSSDDQFRAVLYNDASLYADPKLDPWRWIQVFYEKPFDIQVGSTTLSTKNLLVVFKEGEDQARVYIKDTNSGWLSGKAKVPLKGLIEWQEADHQRWLQEAD